MNLILFISGAYLLGSFPTAYLVTKIWKGEDIRKIGTGNPGGANVLTRVGILPGLVVILFDILKGVFPAYFSKVYISNPFWAILIATAAVTGHCYSLFLKFKGGQGLATSCGVGLVFFPKILLLSVLTGGILGLSFTKVYSRGWFSSKLHSISFFSIPVLLLFTFLVDETSLFVFAIILIIVLLSRQILEVLDRRSYGSY